MPTKIEQQNQVKVVIIDDEAHCVNELKKLLETDKRILLSGSTTDPSEAIDLIIKTKPTLLFLDIQMPGTSGFDIIKTLKQSGMKPFIIFVTAYDEFAIEAICYSVFDYLLKPIDKNELSRALERFFTTYKESTAELKYTHLLEKIASNSRIKFNTVGGFTLIDIKDIVFIKADWNYSEIHFSNEKFELVTMNLGALEKMLEGYPFLRINRSTIINFTFLQRVKRLSRACFLQKDGVEYEFRIPIGRIREMERLIS